MSSLARRYGQAYFELARDAKDLDGWRNELAGLVDVFANPEVSQAAQNPKLPLSQRVRLALDLLDGASGQVRNLARLLVERRRTSLLPEILAFYDKLADRESGIVRAEIITAVPVGDRIQREIMNTLSKRFGTSVRTEVRQDSSILGGLVIRVGDHVIDDSVRTHLQQLQSALT
ncbi:MAG: F0F1 ATP synthase subunit delta [Candidatus Dormibacteraeota bacterium]|nr:F0F1 ATP synthase subunit delta [Candidatus Dormibacteraeota bacterium]